MLTPQMLSLDSHLCISKHVYTCFETENTIFNSDFDHSFMVDLIEISRYANQQCRISKTLFIRFTVKSTNTSENWLSVLPFDTSNWNWGKLSVYRPFFKFHQFCIPKSSCFMRETAVKQISFFLEMLMLYEEAECPDSKWNKLKRTYPKCSRAIFCRFFCINNFCLKVASISQLSKEVRIVDLLCVPDI